MKYYTIDIDRNTPIGQFIGDYGNYKWNNGFLFGFVSGFSVGAFLMVNLMKK